MIPTEIMIKFMNLKLEMDLADELEREAMLDSESYYRGILMRRAASNMLTQQLQKITKQQEKTMKVEVIKKDEAQKEWKYPLLVVSESGNIVLALGDSIPGIFRGAQIGNGKKDSNDNNQHFSNAWDKSAFKPFTGEIKLSNN